jgi:hypothetical protein
MPAELGDHLGVYRAGDEVPEAVIGEAVRRVLEGVEGDREAPGAGHLGQGQAGPPSRCGEWYCVL